MLQGETILSGAPVRCPECNTYTGIGVFSVLKSSAGYYVGTFCKCGPYSRETEYGTREQAEIWLQELQQGDFTHARGNTGQAKLISSQNRMWGLYEEIQAIRSQLDLLNNAIKTLKESESKKSKELLLVCDHINRDGTSAMVSLREVAFCSICGFSDY